MTYSWLPFLWIFLAGAVLSLSLQWWLAGNPLQERVAVDRADAAPASPIVALRAASLFVLGAVVPLFTRNMPWRAGFAFAAGVGATYTALSLLPPLSNLFPIVVMLMLLVAAVPAFLGSAVTSIVLSRRAP